MESDTGIENEAAVNRGSGKIQRRPESCQVAQALRSQSFSFAFASHLIDNKSDRDDAHLGPRNGLSEGSLS